MKVAVIIPAAGASKRYGGKGKKIFETIKGQAVFIKSLELFVNRDDVCQVQLVVAPEDMETMKERYAPTIGFMGIKLTAGGADRTASVRNALAKVDPQAELVCVHDAARPCVSPVWVDAVFAAAARHGSAILAYPVHGTLKTVGPDGAVDQTLPRQAVWEAQTPQVFRRELLLEAYAKAAGPATDDAALVEALGQKVHVVAGDARNIKITTRSDLAIAAAVIDTLPKPKPKATGRGPFDEAQW
jgi:2-C-methyl-D-erythritol 4-phosphate cytidylyltransferase